MRQQLLKNEHHSSVRLNVCFCIDDLFRRWRSKCSNLKNCSICTCRYTKGAKLPDWCTFLNSWANSSPYLTPTEIASLHDAVYSETAIHGEQRHNFDSSVLASAVYQTTLLVNMPGFKYYLGAIVVQDEDLIF